MEAQDSTSSSTQLPEPGQQPTPEAPPERKKYRDRQEALRELEELRPGRLTVSLFNLDRHSTPHIQGLSTQFDANVKEPLFRVLKESFALAEYDGVDLCLYTRGGDTNSVWPIVNLIREFDPNFQVLVPFRCHSSGTLVALGAKSIAMGPISELSPIDPTCGNQFNPPDPADPNNRQKLGISVEDVQSYRDFLLEHLFLTSPTDGQGDTRPEGWRALLVPLVEKLTKEVHPLALGNVHRVIRQIEKLARQLLAFHPREGEDASKVIADLTTRFFSHTHMLDRHEAKGILGERVQLADEGLSKALDNVLACYKQSFRTWEPFFWIEKLGDKLVDSFEFVGGIVESRHWSYLYRTSIRVTQSSTVPQGVNVQIPPGQPMPLIPGLPRQRNAEIIAQGWTRNSAPTGVTV